MPEAKGAQRRARSGDVRPSASEGKKSAPDAGKEEASRQYRRFVTRLNDSRDDEIQKALRGS